MSNAETFVNVVCELYPARAEHCIDALDDSRLLVYEGDDARSYIKPLLDQEPGPFLGFLVKNDNNLRICLLALDGCFFRSDDSQRCDCLVFDDNYLCFVELKIEVGRRQSTRKLRDARDQLGASIQFFRENLLCDPSTSVDYKLEAYAIMQDNVYPRNSASRNIVFVQFLEKYGVELFETNTKTF